MIKGNAKTTVRVPIWLLENLIETAEEWLAENGWRRNTSLRNIARVQSAEDDIRRARRLL